MPRPLGPCVLRPVPPVPPRSSLSRLCAPPLAHPQRLKCPHLTGLRGSGVSPRNTVPQSPPAPDASRLHTPKDTRHPGLSRAWRPQPHCPPSAGRELPIHLPAGTPDPPRPSPFDFRDGKRFFIEPTPRCPLSQQTALPGHSQGEGNLKYNSVTP